MKITEKIRVERQIKATVRPNRTDNPQMINSVKRYFPTLLIFGVRSSKCPIRILPKAYTMLTRAISNQSDSVVHMFFELKFSYQWQVNTPLRVHKTYTQICVHAFHPQKLKKWPADILHQQELMSFWKVSETWIYSDYHPILDIETLYYFSFANPELVIKMKSSMILFTFILTKVLFNVFELKDSEKLIDAVKNKELIS